MKTPDDEENTEDLLSRAKNLINAEYRSLHFKDNDKINTLKNDDNTPKSSGKRRRLDEVKAARKKIQKEWEALKNTSIVSPVSPPADRNDHAFEILWGVVAYLEVNNKAKTSAMKVILENLGATVKDSFSNEVTHVIFKQGSPETYKRAKLLNVHLVSVLWIEACKNSKSKVPEILFPVNDSRNYADSPRVFRRFMEMGARERENLLSQAIARNLDKDTDKNNEKSVKEQSDRRVTRSSTRSANNENSNNDSDEIRLRISSDESSVEKAVEKRRSKNFEKSNSDDNPKPTSSTPANGIKPRKLFKTLSNEKQIKAESVTKNVENGKFVKKIIINPITRRKLFAPNLQGNSRGDGNWSDTSRPATPVAQLNPYQDEVNKIKKIRRKIGALNRSTNKRNSGEGAKKLEEEKKKTSKVFKSRRKIDLYAKCDALPSLVSTSLHTIENKSLKELIERMGGFVFKANVVSDTTHLVSGETRRTVNLLKAIARGCWIVKKQWVLDSVSAGHWLPEHPYEMTEFSNAVQKSRLERAALGADYLMDIFRDTGPVYVSPKSAPACKDLRELLRLCSATIVLTMRGAEVVVGECVSSHPRCVSEKWVLDSIVAGRCKSFKKYMLFS